MHYAMPMPVIGAGPHERSATRSNQRNGSRPRTLNTAAGDLELRISKLRADSGISKNELSRVCADLDTEVAAFRNRPVAEQRFPYVYLDATYCKARVNHQVVSQALVIAIRVAADGRREVLGSDVGDSEDGAFWTAFLRSLKSRGLAGVALVISDAHIGLRAAIEAVLIGASWQRRVYFLRNVLAQTPKGSAEMVAAAIRTIFAQPDAEHVREQLDTIAGMLGRPIQHLRQDDRRCCADGLSSPQPPSDSSGSRMRLVVHGSQPGDRNVGVQLRCGQ